MIHIGICDDEKGMQKQIYDIVQHELFEDGWIKYSQIHSGVSGGCGYYLCNRIAGTCL